ncbi:DUF3667 domain-containing protein [Aquimarina sp. M1]
MSAINRCKNCEKSFDESFDYCPYCGQETADKLTFGILFSNTISNYFSIDARFFRSFIPLMTQPGVLARRFVDGKRLSYLHPAQFYLFISVVFFFAFSFHVRKADDNLTRTFKKGFGQEIQLDSLNVMKDSMAMAKATEAIKKNVALGKFSQEEMNVIDSLMSAKQKGPVVSFSFDRVVLDSLISVNATEAEKLKAMGLEEDDGAITKKFYTQMLKFYENKGGGILNTLYDTIPITMFLMLPLFAFILKIFYWRRGSFAHHMVFSFYFFTFVFTSFCILILANSLLEIPIWLQSIFYLSFIVYLIIAFRNFYKSSWITAFLKANMVSFIYMMFIVPIAFLGVMTVSIFLY